MPFDDTTRTTDTVRILDEVIAVLGPKGERWSQRVYHNRKGQHCLRGALHYARRKLKTPAGDRATDCIRQAIREIPGLLAYWAYVEPFNDRREAKFRGVRAVLARARQLANE
jgi:hypothetical protein